MSEPMDTVLVRKTSWSERAHATYSSVRVRVLVGIAASGLLALLYLSQVAAVNTASGHLADVRSQYIQLERQDADLHQQLGAVTSPAYIDRRARAMGLTPDGTGTSAIAIAVNLRLTGNAGGRP